MKGLFINFGILYFNSLSFDYLFISFCVSSYLYALTRIINSIIQETVVMICNIITCNSFQLHFQFVTLQDECFSNTFLKFLFKLPVIINSSSDRKTHPLSETFQTYTRILWHQKFYAQNKSCALNSNNASEESWSRSGHITMSRPSDI